MTPNEADAKLDMVEAGTVADPCKWLKDLLDIMAEEPETFEAQIARACNLLVFYGCPSHPACGGSA